MKFMAETIQKLMADGDYDGRIAEQCMLRVSEYNIRNTVVAYLEIYKQLMK